jgi:hypothetical protein
MFKLKYLRAAVVIAFVLSAAAGQNQPETDEEQVSRKDWEAEWKARLPAFQRTLKTLQLEAKAPPVPQCVGVAMFDWLNYPKGRAITSVTIPVGRARIKAIKGFVRETADPKSPWWQCPFELGKECGQIASPNNPNADIHPGGAAYLPFTVTDLFDGTTTVSAENLNWSGHLIREFRLEVDYAVQQ